MDAVPMPQVGETLRGKYRITGKLGEGGMGVVFQALDTLSQQPVAIKMLRPEMLENAETVARFDRESRAVSQLKGAHIARVLDVDFLESGLPYIVMELLDGRDLAAEIDLRGTIAIDEAVDYVLQACAAMIEAHALGIIHRDLKPSNLFISDTGGSRMLKVLDFGISKIVSDDEVRMTMTQASFGTPLYMSPEQVRSSKRVDVRTDVWSLGVILYELLLGRPPFLGSATAAAAAIVTEDPPAPSRLRNDLPDGIELVLLTALQKDPAKRYPDVASFARALGPFAPSAPISGGRLAAVQREAESNKKIKLTPAVSGSATVVRASRFPEIVDARVHARRSRARRKRALATGVAVAMGLLAVGLFGLAIYRSQRPDPGAAAGAATPPATLEIDTPRRPVSTHSVRSTESSAMPWATGTVKDAPAPANPNVVEPKRPAPPKLPVSPPSAPSLNPKYL